MDPMYVMARVLAIMVVSTLLFCFMVPTLLRQEAYAATVNASIVPGAGSKTTGAYSPYPINVRVGDTIIWTNKDSTTHTVRSGTPQNPTNYFGTNNGNPIFIAPGNTFQFTFSKAGAFPYYCVIHPNMVGKVNVGTSVVINNVGKTEGDSGTKSFTFKITRSGIIGGTSSVKFATASATAIAGSDFVSKTGTVSFAAGETAKFITVTVKGDTVVEANEKFNVNLSNCVGCTIVDNRGIGTILNDDP